MSVVIGKGQYGKVYAESKDTAIKITSMLRIKDMVGPFCFDHPNIVKVLNLNVNPGDRTVDILMERGIPCNEEKFLLDPANFIKQILAGLLYLHSNMVIHQDVKCSNIIQSGDFFKIIDYGLSRIHYNDIEKIPALGLHSAPEMMWPNIHKRYVDYDSDVYMFGFSLRTMITDVSKISEYDTILKELRHHTRRSPSKQTKTYIRYQHAVLGNGNELRTHYGIENEYRLPEVTPVRFDDPEIEALVTAMTTININNRPSVRQLLERDVFTSVPYSINDSWYNSHPHPEPQYYTIANDNRTNITESDISNANMKLYNKYSDHIRRSFDTSDYAVVEIGCSILQRCMKRFYVQLEDLEAYMLLSLIVSNNFVGRSSKILTVPSQYVHKYRDIIHAFGMEILSGCMTYYLYSEYNITSDLASTIILNLIRIWNNPSFINVRTKKKCDVAVGISTYGDRYVPESDDSVIMYNYLSEYR